MLDAAIRASSGGNTQHWNFIVVRDAEKRRQPRLALWQGLRLYRLGLCCARTPEHLSQAQYDRFLAGSSFSRDHMVDAPVILVPCLASASRPSASLPEVVQARYAEHLANQQRISGSSIYPAIQNIILACRALGLGTVTTTNHILYEDQVKARARHAGRCRHLRPDADRLSDGKYGPLTRKPVAEVTYADTWGNAWPVAANGDQAT